MALGTRQADVGVSPEQQPDSDRITSRPPAHAREGRALRLVSEPPARVGMLHRSFLCEQRLEAEDDAHLWRVHREAPKVMLFAIFVIVNNIQYSAVTRKDEYLRYLVLERFEPSKR